MVFMRKAWNDSVWSKVIASGITTGLGATFVVLFRYWELSKGVEAPILRVANAPVMMPAWLAVVLGIVLLGLAGFAVHRGRKSAADEDAVEPNAVPIVEAAIVTPGSMLAKSVDLSRGCEQP
jgi:hypothetical protein